MNFLQLCKRLRSEAGLSGSGPATVLSQTGEMGRVVDWITEAYETVQNHRPDWAFLHDSFTFPTIASTSEYLPTAVSITDLNSWDVHDLRIYSSVADEIFLIYEPWSIFRASYQYGSLRSQTGKPTVVSVKPDDSLIFWPTPDQVYTVDGQYYKQPDTMTLDTDTPVFKSNFHMIIVWGALMLYGAYTGAPDAYAHGQSEFNKIMKRLELNQLPKITFGAPLA